MRTFRVVRWIRILYLSLLLIMLGSVVSFGWLSFNLSRSMARISDEPNPLAPLASALLCSFPFLVLCLWLWLFVRAAWKGRLVFEEQALVFESVNHFTSFLTDWLRPFRLPYAQIRDVRAGTIAGTVEITNVDGGKKLFFPSAFSGKLGEAVLIELRNHVPAEKFSPDMEMSRIRRAYSRQNKISIALVAVVLTAYLATLYLDPESSSRPGLVHAWQVEQRLAWLESVRRFAPDPDGKFWVAASGLNSYHIYRFPGQSDQEWKFPESLLGKQYLEQVSGDKQGTPIVWLDDGVYHYESGAWRKIPYAPELDLKFWSFNNVVTGEQGWTIRTQGEDAVLVKIEALSGQGSVLPLPESATSRGLRPLSLRRAVNGDLLVLMEGQKDGQVYLLSGSDWKPQEYTIAGASPNSILDYFLDVHGSLWVLITDMQEYHVEKIAATGEASSTRLPVLAQGTHGWQHYESLLVDASGRVWMVVTGGDASFISVFRPVWNGSAVELVRYSPKNSNYQSDSLRPPVMLPDGKIWGMDERIVSMDTNLAALPAPLPDWFAAWNWTNIRLGVVFGQICVLLVFLWYQRRLASGKHKQ